MKKKIALDLDGVVFDSENLYRVYTEIYDTDVKKSDNIVDNTKRLFFDRYNWSMDEVNNLYKTIAPIVLKSANFVTGADLVIPKLMKSFDIIIVTARPKSEMNYAYSKLKKLNLDNVKIFVNEHSKIDRFLEEKVDYIIDDDEDICKRAALNKIKALYFKNNAAPVVNDPFIKNVNNWGEIYKYLILNNE